MRFVGLFLASAAACAAVTTGDVSVRDQLNLRPRFDGYLILPGAVPVYRLRQCTANLCCPYTHKCYTLGLCSHSKNKPIPMIPC